MNMTIIAKVYDYANKISAKGNAYTILRLKQDSGFEYFDVMISESALEKYRLATGEKLPLLNTEMSFVLTYNVKYRSFLIIEIL